MSYQRIEDAECPQLGETYLVPCIHRNEVRYDVNRRWRRVWYPVIGPWHEDSEHIGFSSMHFHYDFRFIQVIPNWIGSYSASGNRVQQAMLSVLVAQNSFEPTPKWRALKMVRQTQEFPIVGRTAGKPTVWFKGLEDAFRDKSAKCLRCPHRGFNLKDSHRKILPDGRKVYVCPGHGLQFDASTGELVPRLNDDGTIANHLPYAHAQENATA